MQRSFEIFELHGEVLVRLWREEYSSLNNTIMYMYVCSIYGVRINNKLSWLF
jgi:hypothetical protein